MATRDQLMTGLRAAHDAGDTDAATAIARQIQQMDSGPGSGAGSPPAADPSVGQTPDPNSFSQQLLGHIARAYVAPYQQASAAQDAMKNFLNSYTAGIGNRVYSAVTGTPVKDLRADTEAAQNRLGPVLSTITGGAGYVMGPGKLLGPTAKAVSGPLANVAGTMVPSAIEGATSSALQAGGEGKSAQDMGTAAETGGIAGTIFGPLSKGVANLGGKIKPYMPSTDDMQNAAANMWDRLKGVSWSGKQVQNASRNALLDAGAGGQPMTEVGNLAAFKTLNNFSDAATSGQSFSVKDLHDWQAAAKALPEGDSQYGNLMHNRIEEILQNTPPAKVPKGMNAGDVPASIMQARDAQTSSDIFSRLDDMQNQAKLGGQGTRAAVGSYLRTDPQIDPDYFDALRNIQQGTTTGNVAQYLKDHSWRIGHMIPEVAMLAAAGAGGEHAVMGGGELPAAVGSIAGIAAGIPAVNATTGAVANASTANLVDAAKRTVSGSAQPYTDTALQDLIRRGMIGGTTAQQ